LSPACPILQSFQSLCWAKISNIKIFADFAAWKPIEQEAFRLLRLSHNVFGKTEDEELFREGQRKRKDMGSGFKEIGEKNEEGEVKCGNLEKNTKWMKYLCSWMNLTHETVSDQTL
jgi:hypothetical protein